MSKGMINKKCRHFPCHKGIEDCRWCFCPLYPCFNSTTNGRLIRAERKRRNELVWSCIDCLWPHKKENLVKLKDLKPKESKLESIPKLYNKKIKLMGIEVGDGIMRDGMVRDEIVRDETGNKRRDKRIIIPKEAVERLKRIKGLSDFLVLNEKAKRDILRLELREEGRSKKVNLGVREALYRKTTICCLHNSSFRKPAMPIVIGAIGGEIVGEQGNDGFRFYKKIEEKNKGDKVKKNINKRERGIGNKGELDKCREDKPKWDRSIRDKDKGGKSRRGRDKGDRGIRAEDKRNIEYILPGLPFPELEGLKCVVSASPSFTTDAYLRDMLKNIPGLGKMLKLRGMIRLEDMLKTKGDDADEAPPATLLIGFD